MFVSIGNSRMDKKFNCADMTYEDFVSRLSKTKYTAETMEQYRKMPKGQQDNIKDVGGFVLGKLKGGRRKKDCVISRSAITLDMDYGTQGIIDELEMFFDIKMVVYSTHKYTSEKPRLRIIIFLTRDVTPDEYGAVSRMLASDIGIELFDDSTYEPSRLMYWPSTSSDGEYVFQEIDGAEVDPDEVLARYKDWHDVSAWPVSNRQASVVQRDIKKQADPLSKDGLIGAFNRTYTVTQAIDKFIPDVYRHSRAIPGRYDYIPADSAAGVVVYDDLFVYSHHATDPCCGKLMNAFDVVRLHKFGDKDARAAEGTEPGKLPSFKAMQDFASADEEVKNTLAKERQELAVQEFSTEPDEDWQNKLALDRRGNIKDTLQNIALIIRNDENFKHIVYNEFKDTIDVIGPLPWKQVKPGWNDSDLANAKVYFERVYGIWSPTKFKDALLAVVSSDRLYHPIKDYFATLHWDGQERIDTLLIDYFGAKDSPYTRAVIRKTLVAAVARIYKPGVKFDSILVLNGPQGMGKSTFFSILGKQWFSDSLSISDMRDKTAAEKLLGNWILEISEMKAVDYLDMPECVSNRVSVTMSESEQALYDRMADEMILEYGEGQDIDAVNAAALSNKLQQMANGAVYDESGNVRNIHDRKLDALEDLIESANGKPLLVAYWFKHDRERILKRFPARDINTKKDIDDWNAGKIPIALIHPASAGHGLNLQEGGSAIVWFSLTWSLELYQQLNARLYRQGQKHTVVIEHLVTDGTVDEDILRAIERKDNTQNAMIEAVKARIGGMADDGRSNDEGI